MSLGNFEMLCLLPVGLQRRLLAEPPALAVPGTSLWKNHPSLWTATALFPSYLFSTALGKGQDGCQGRGRGAREGSYGKEKSKALVEVAWEGSKGLSVEGSH